MEVDPKKDSVSDEMDLKRNSSGRKMDDSRKSRSKKKPKQKVECNKDNKTIESRKRKRSSYSPVPMCLHSDPSVNNRKKKKGHDTRNSRKSGTTHIDLDVIFGGRPRRHPKMKTEKPKTKPKATMKTEKPKRKPKQKAKPVKKDTKVENKPTEVPEVIETHSEAEQTEEEVKAPAVPEVNEEKKQAEKEVSEDNSEAEQTEEVPVVPVVSEDNSEAEQTEEVPVVPVVPAKQDSETESNAENKQTEEEVKAPVVPVVPVVPAKQDSETEEETRANVVNKPEESEPKLDDNKTENQEKSDEDTQKQNRAGKPKNLEEADPILKAFAETHNLEEAHKLLDASDDEKKPSIVVETNIETENGNINLKMIGLLKNNKKEQKFKCTVDNCDESRSTQGQINIHLQKDHKASFQCSKCDKFYETANGRDKHYKKHFHHKT